MRYVAKNIWEEDWIDEGFESEEEAKKAVIEQTATKYEKMEIIEEEVVQGNDYFKVIELDCNVTIELGSRSVSTSVIEVIEIKRFD